MDEKDWHEWRFQGIGGSDIAAVLGLMPFGITPYMKWEEKVNRIIPQETEAMRHGKKYEDPALDWFEQQKGTALWRQIPTVDKEHSWLRATIDGLDAEGKYLVEAKAPYNLENHYRIKESRKVPDIYYPQCQQQMRVRGVTFMFFLSYNWENPDDSVILEVEKNDGFVSQIIEKGSAFWDHVMTKEPPPLTDYDYVSMDGNQNWEQFALEYRQIQEKMDAYEKRKDEIKIALRSIAKDKSARGAGIELQKQPCRGFVDYTKVPQLKGICLDPYRKEGFTKWPIRVIKK